jgi:uncharacterized protein
MQNITKRFPNKRFLLCLDEFERFNQIFDANPENTRFLDFLRNTIQHNPQWILLFSGSHRMKELPTYWSDCLISAHTLHLTYLSEMEARELIIKPVPNFPDEVYSPAAIQAILHLTHGQPYALQFTCKVLIEHLNTHYRLTQTHRPATAEDVEEIIPELFRTYDGYFTEFWNTLTSPQQQVLHRIANHQPLPSTTQRATLTNLITAEILELHNDIYRFQVPLIDRYVQTIEL